MKEPRQKEPASQRETDEAVPFDDCLRILVNTPPKPKKAEGDNESPEKPEQPKTS